MLLDHYRATNHMVVCEGCPHRNGEETPWDPDREEYQAHLSNQNVCKACCGKHFRTRRELVDVSVPTYSSQPCYQELLMCPLA